MLCFRMAEYRIDQATPGAGTPGIARHDLIAGEQITLVATAPVGAGVTYAWEVLDRLGSTAPLSSATGPTVVLGTGGSTIVQPCAFRVRMTANDNGVITTMVRVFGVPTANLGLRLPTFAETAPATGTHEANDPSRSDDNAFYPDLSGLGITAQNWRGWAEWAYQVTLAVDNGGGGGGGGGPPSGAAGGDLGGTYPNPSVARVNGRAFANTLPTSGQVPTWNNGTSRYEPATPSTAPTGSAGGDLGGTYPNPTVTSIQGSSVSVTAPSVGDLLQWDGDKWTPTAPAAPVSSGGDFIFRPGGVAGGNVYTTWATLEAAVNGQDGPRVVYIDQDLAQAYIDTAVFAIDGWDIRSYRGAIEGLGINDGCTMTVTNASTFFTLRGISLTPAGSVTSHAFVLTGTFASLRVNLYDSNMNGVDGDVELIHMNLGAGNGALSIDLYGESILGSSSVLATGTFASVYLDLYDRSAVYDPTAIVPGSPASSLSVGVYSEEARYTPQTYTGQVDYNGTGRTDALAIMDMQVGTTEKLVGSFYLRANTLILYTTGALLGGSTITEGARLNIKFGPTLIAYFEIAASTLDHVAVVDPATTSNNNILVTAAGWYDVYLSAPSAPETAVVHGLNLHMLSLS